MSYRGIAKQFLESQNISIGDMISLKKDNVEYQGMLLDRAEDADQLHIVLKMDSGYNVGIAIEGAEVELLEKGEKPEINLPPLVIQQDPKKKNVSIVSTGGTVASIIDYKTSNYPKNKNDIEDYWIQTAFYAIAHNEMFNTNITNLVIIMGVNNKLPLVFKSKINQSMIEKLNNRCNQFKEISIG